MTHTLGFVSHWVDGEGLYLLKLLLHTHIDSIFASEKIWPLSKETEVRAIDRQVDLKKPKPNRAIRGHGFRTTLYHIYFKK